MDELFSRVREAQDAALESSTVRDSVEPRVLAHARAPRAHAPKRPRWAPAAAAAIVALGVGGATTWAVMREPAWRAPLSFVVEGGVSSVGGFVAALEPADVRFSDESVVHAHRGAAARIVSTSADGAWVAIESGEIDAAIVHDETTDWRFLAGPFAIVVTGTRFDARWSPAAAELVVSVTEGSVRVEGACLDEPRAVRAGDVMRATCEGWAPEPSSEPPSSSASTDVTPVDESSAIAAIGPVRRPREASAEPPDGPAPPDVPEVPDVAVAPPTAPTAEAPSAPSSDAQIESATRAALAGDVDGAERTLRSVREGSPGTSDASLAAFLLGRLAFDEQHDYEDAARWFAAYAEERPNGPLAREAMGRELEARARSGDAAGARAVAERYLARFPDGPHASRARELTATPRE